MRIREIDLARGFTVLIMAPVHTVLVFGSPAVRQGGLGKILAFLAEGPGAPLFMLLMGISFTLSSRNNLKGALSRALQLLVLAYTLNALKFLIPWFMGWIPSRLLSDFGLRPGPGTWLRLLGTGDILQFAALSLVVLSLVYRIREYPICATLLGVSVLLIAPDLWGLACPCPFTNYLEGLFWGKTPVSFFPLFPWLVFPVAGLVTGFFLRRGNLPGWGCLACGAGLLVLGCFLNSIPWIPESLDFYHMGPGDCLIHLGIALVWLCLCRACTLWIPGNPVMKGFSYLSRRITRIYMLQWVLVFWLLGWFGYESMGLGKSLFWMTLNDGLVIGLSLAWDHWRKQGFSSFRSFPLRRTR